MVIGLVIGVIGRRERIARNCRGSVFPLEYFGASFSLDFLFYFPRRVFLFHRGARVWIDRVMKVMEVMGRRDGAGTTEMEGDKRFRKEWREMGVDV